MRINKVLSNISVTRMCPSDPAMLALEGVVVVEDLEEEEELHRV